MRVITVRPPRKQKKHYPVRRVVSWLLVVLIITGVINYSRPLPKIMRTEQQLVQYPAKTAQLEWPSYGQSSIATADSGILASSGSQTPLATASIAKVITALCILEKYPLLANQSGPTITISATDVAIYNDYLSKDGSVIAVQDGEQLTERQLLEAMMLPSANNIADSAATWAYGNLTSYISYANTFLATHGITNTHVAVDASGFDGATTSTASDLARLGSLVLAQPTLAEIVSEPSATLPIVGIVYNYNGALGQEGIYGIKTGNNDQDSGAFLFAAKLPITGSNSATVTVTGAVMGASSLRSALLSGIAILASAKTNFSDVEISNRDAVLATYIAPWGAMSHARAIKDQSQLRWNGSSISRTLDLQSVQAGSRGTVGALNAIATSSVTSPNKQLSIPVTLDRPLAGPSFWWRLSRH